MREGGNNREYKTRVIGVDKEWHRRWGSGSDPGQDFALGPMALI